MMEKDMFSSVTVTYMNTAAKLRQGDSVEQKKSVR